MTQPLKRTIAAKVLQTGSIIAACLLVSCGLYSEDGTEYVTASFRERTLYEERPPESVRSTDTSYTVAVISDVHFGRDNMASVRTATAQFAAWLKGMAQNDRPRFVVCLGDVAHHGWVSEMNEYAAWMHTIEAIPTGGGGHIKVYNALGNHDAYHKGYGAWKAVTGCHSFYHFAAGGVSWYFIDAINAGRDECSLDSILFKELQKALAADKCQKVICSHFALYNDNGHDWCVLKYISDEAMRRAFLSLPSRYGVKTILSGHQHNDFTVYPFEGFTEYSIPNLYGGGWALLTVTDDNITVEAKP